jgi:hypothetical protein
MSKVDRSAVHERDRTTRRIIAHFFHHLYTSQLLKSGNQPPCQLQTCPQPTADVRNPYLSTPKTGSLTRPQITPRLSIGVPRLHVAHACKPPTIPSPRTSPPQSLALSKGDHSGFRYRAQDDAGLAVHDVFFHICRGLLEVRAVGS